MANNHESNPILAFRIERRYPFVARVRRSRDIGSRHEKSTEFQNGLNRSSFSKNSVLLTNSNSEFRPPIRRWEIDSRWNL